MLVETYRFNRGKATRALTETEVIDKTGIVQVAMPFRHAPTTIAY
jgi:hypothetical protein